MENYEIIANPTLQQFVLHDDNHNGTTNKKKTEYLQVLWFSGRSPYDILMMVIGGNQLNTVFLDFWYSICLVSRKIWKYIRNVKVDRVAEIGSDHYLVKMEINTTGKKQKEKHKKAKGKICSHKLNEEQCKKTYRSVLRERNSEYGRQTRIDAKWQWIKKNMLEAAVKSCGIAKSANNNWKATSWWRVKQIEDIIQKRQLGWLGHVEENVAGKVFEAKHEGKDRKGGPRKTWVQTAREAAEQRGLPWNNARQQAQDRKS
ncbi:hypothetical protein ILUMI_13380 [Ignelater luminosus]|uniref:Uncharacterized protein n=1 Tax=Ignelater luminosus TaxID=2038154 RepID=A0A8K0CYP2_IGNLU|nr:hypothetical protein ILUMI_13380 [Ignelater luminosus]